MAQPFQVSLALANASANNIAQSQTPAGAGNLTLNGTTAGTLDTARRVLFTPAGAEAGNGTIWTVTGTNRTGNAITEVVNGVDNPSVAYTVQDFKTVTQIAVNKAQAGAVTVGTNGIASTAWYVVNRHTTPMNFGVCVVVGGTINWSVEYTYDDPNAPFTSTYPTTWTQSALASKATSLDAAATFIFPIFAIRLTQNSFSSGGTAKMIVIQAGLGGGN